MYYANMDIRTAAKNSGVRFWEIAQAMHISEPTITRKLRCELSAEQKSEILAVIKSIAAAR
nr:hypothetical protein [uncultured Ruminococcus sp.]